MPTFQATTELLGPSRFIRELACIIFAAASATAAQWRVNVQYSLNFTVKQLSKFIDIRTEELYSLERRISWPNDVISILRRDR